VRARAVSGIFRLRANSMTGEITYRTATAADAAAAARVQVGSWQASYKNILPPEFLTAMSVEKRTAALRARLTERGSFYQMFVAEREGLVVGVCDVGTPRRESFDCAAELYMIYLAWDYQRRGIGRELFRRAGQFLLDAGRNSVFLEALADNPYRNFYDKLGGEVCGHGQHEIGGRLYATVFYRWPRLAETLRTLAGRAR
jgi:GNAT superfamily N-acetyltransferase